MIHELSSNKTSFKPHKFNKGLNVVSKDRNENNSLLINIIHFCLGCENFKKNLPIRKLKDHKFTLTLDLFGEKISATRAINNPSQIEIKGNCKNFPIIPTKNYYSLKEWKRLLERAFFEYNHDKNIKFQPSFDMLSHYFIRKNSDFKSVFKNQISTSFLLGLDWKLTSRYKELNDELKKLSKENSKLKDNYASKGEIIPEINRLTVDINKFSDKLENFKIHKSYDNIRKNADELKSEIHDLNDESMILEKKLKKYNEAVKEEDISDDFNISEIYEQCNFIFNDKIKSTLEESEKFHSNIIKNRRDFLEDEMNSIKNRLDEIDNIKKKKSEKKLEYQEILNNSGSLSEYEYLQKKLFEKKEKFNELSQIISRYDEITFKKQNIKKELFNLESELQINYQENKLHLNHLINLFSENSSKIYNSPGNLIIECSEKGIEFSIEIPDDKKSEMSTLCFDLMLAEDLEKIDFLVHDSSVFNCADEKLIRNSMNLIHEKNLQYICMVNSNDYTNFNKVIT